MATHPLPPWTFVVVGSHLGQIVNEARLGPVDGYSVTTAVEGHEGSAPHFVAAHAVQVAEVGVNVCREPRGQHWCGLVHVSRPDLLNGNPS